MRGHPTLGCWQSVRGGRWGVAHGEDLEMLSSWRGTRLPSRQSSCRYDLQGRQSRSARGVGGVGIHAHQGRAVILAGSLWRPSQSS